MVRKEPLLFNVYPRLKEKIPWIPLLTNAPSPVERLHNLEDYLKLNNGQIYIKRDDKIHNIYGGNKLRKFEFIFGNALMKKKIGIVTFGGIGTNHGLACAIICNKLSLKCNIFLFSQPITWHVQRSLLLFDYFGAKLHPGGSDITTFIKALLFQIRKPKYYFMFPGGSPLFGFGTSLGTIGFINAALELKEQIDRKLIPKPDEIFIAGASTGSSAGLVAGCRLLGLNSRINIVSVYTELTSNSSAVIRNANKAIKLLHKQDKNVPRLKISEEDFNFIKGYLGSGYGIKTLKSQNAVDKVFELEGKNKGFSLDTTYTGKVMAALFDFLTLPENKDKIVLFWNTYNSNSLDSYLKETKFNYKKLPKKLHEVFENDLFQCWQITDCLEDIRINCPAYFHHEYRFWKVTECLLEEEKREKAHRVLKEVIKLENG
ncbi:MAG: 1-aminocyclopropane-1-carboxylate deaminase/D-cysteine desulfhydrase [Promethearchaeota archaeon]